MTDRRTPEPPIEARLVQPEEVRPVSTHPPPPERLLQNKAMVLLILFTVTGFLGVPLLWINKKFSSLERAMWSVIVTLYTLALIYAVVLICLWSYRQLMGG